MSERICQQCGGYRTKKTQARFCSLACAAQAQIIIRTDCCENCGKILRRQQVRFCSRSCHSAKVIEQHKNEPLQTALTQLWHKGLTTIEIGRRLHISKNAVIGKAHRWGLPARPSPIRPAGPDVPRIKTPFFLHDARATEGRDPLPPMHPISWGAIAL